MPAPSPLQSLAKALLEARRLNRHGAHGLAIQRLQEWRPDPTWTPKCVPEQQAYDALLWAHHAAVERQREGMTHAGLQEADHLLPLLTHLSPDTAEGWAG